ncbi:hypothetical protein [Gordonia terrae]
MANRFTSPYDGGDGYQPQAERIAAAEAMPIRRKTRDATLFSARNDDGTERLTEYIQAVATLTDVGACEDDGSPIPSTEPLGHTLPAGITPTHASDLAHHLDATLPRLSELLALFKGRAAEQG